MNLKLFIHRWFGGSVHPHVWWDKSKQWNYPRLANWAVPWFFTAMLFYTLGWPWGIPAAGFSSTALLFIYMGQNPLSIWEWYKCYKGYWEKKGYFIVEGVDHWAVFSPYDHTFVVNRSSAIIQMYFDIYKKFPSNDSYIIKYNIFDETHHKPPKGPSH